MDARAINTDVPICPGCAERDRRIRQLEAMFASQQERIKQLEQLVEELRRGGKRQAAPFSKGPPKSKPKKPGRKRGPDHGTHHRRQPPPRIDETHEAELPPACPKCSCDRIDPT